MSTKVSGLFAVAALAAMLVSCDKFDGVFDGDWGSSYGDMFGPSAEPGDGESMDDDQQGGAEAGIVTAGEWCDLDNWAFWSDLLLNHDDESQGEGSDAPYYDTDYQPATVDFTKMPDYWHFYTNNRVAVKVVDAEGVSQCGVKVELQRAGKTIWATTTDNRGEASCWLGLTQQETLVEGLGLTQQGSLVDGLGLTQKNALAEGEDLDIVLDGELQTEHPAVSHFDAENPHTVTVYTHNTTSTSSVVDIAFIVDATGSMGDEMSFLKKDLVDIIGKVNSVRPGLKIRTGTVFYRDEGDAYVTRHSDFTADPNSTATFVGKQSAGGGGDYPEAVHTALECALQNLKWSSDARAKIAFMLLDAPAHHNDDVIASLQKSITEFAAQGIRIIPVAASGVDKYTEFMLRFFAIPTGGTYVFITNDSGVGNSHIEASVGEYKVEYLNDLIVRLIKERVE